MPGVSRKSDSSSVDDDSSTRMHIMRRVSARLSMCASSTRMKHALGCIWCSTAFTVDTRTSSDSTDSRWSSVLSSAVSIASKNGVVTPLTATYRRPSSFARQMHAIVSAASTISVLSDAKRFTDAASVLIDSIADSSVSTATRSCSSLSCCSSCFFIMRARFFFSSSFSSRRFFFSSATSSSSRSSSASSSFFLGSSCTMRAMIV